ncbi:MAG: HD domain-containing protein [Myxococcales bacterium]|nr:HD domain-containing protein [Myxococcales bacterium]
MVEYSAKNKNDNGELSLLAEATPQAVGELCRRFEQGGYRAWAVGGSLRDVLLGRSVADWDLATTARPEEVCRLFDRVIPTGIEHGTVTLIWKKASYEVTTLRAEHGYSDGRRPDHVRFVEDIAEDLARRDFTVNALAYDPLNDTLTDPFFGVNDIRDRRLRTVGDPLQRFSEDGLRVLRAARFVATLEFDLDARTEAAMEPSLPVFRKVAHERVRDEWIKCMAARAPSAAFDIMKRTGLLKVTLPELLEQVDCTQNRWHAFDVWRHTMLCVDQLPQGDAILRMAGLLHDIGKPKSRAFSEKTKEYTFYNHEKLGAELARHWLEDYRFSNADRARIVDLVRHHLVCYAADWTDAAVRRFVRRVSLERVPDLLLLAEADAMSKGRPVDRELELLRELRSRIDKVTANREALSVRELAIDGRDIMRSCALRPGPRIGRILEALLEDVLEDPALNQREILLEHALRHLKALE